MFEHYIQELGQALILLPFDQIQALADDIRSTRDTPATIFIIGNGGAASVAEHFTSDLVRYGFRASCPMSNMALLTALSNDSGYDMALSAQLRYIQPKDILIALSTSGLSKNILAAMWVVPKTVLKWGMTNASGGELWNKVNKNIYVPLPTVGDMVEDVFSIITHMVVRACNGSIDFNPIP